MQNKLWAIGLLAVFAAAACNNGGTDGGAKTPAAQNPCGLSANDSIFITGLNNFAQKFVASDSAYSRSYNMPVPRTAADLWIKEYKDKFGATPPNLSGVKYTDYVAFNIPSFRDWIAKYDVFNRSKFIVIEFGIYTQAAADILNHDQDVNNDIEPAKIGKVTAFISPYLVLPTDATATQAATPGTPATRPAGDPIDPYNLGSLHP
jgi:hypothetical protein